MSRRRRIRDFTAPFVVVVAVGPGCRTPQRAPAPPVPECAKPTFYETVQVPVPSGVGEIFFHDPICEWLDVHGEWHSEVCPEDLLPPAPTDRLIVDDTGGDWVWCFVVRPWPDDPDAWKEGRVRCPDGGPTAVIPDPSEVTIGADRIQISNRTLTCSRYVFANPPYWHPVEKCPAPLLPSLINGATVTDRVGTECFWNDVRVRCP
jgi:hypothetical protein